jgi:hypothetical protein
MGILNVIGPHELGSHRIGIGPLADYRNAPRICLPDTLARATRDRCAIAITGPASRTTLATLLVTSIPPGIEDAEECVIHPFATTQVCRHSWIGLRPHECIRKTVGKPLADQLGGALTALPTAVTLIWAMLAWHKCRGRRLLGHFRVRTRSTLSDGRRIVVGQPYEGAPITLSTLSDHVEAPDLGILRLFSR